MSSCIFSSAEVSDLRYLALRLKWDLPYLLRRLRRDPLAVQYVRAGEMGKLYFHFKKRNLYLRPPR